MTAREPIEATKAVLPVASKPSEESQEAIAALDSNATTENIAKVDNVLKPTTNDAMLKAEQTAKEEPSPTSEVAHPEVKATSKMAQAVPPPVNTSAEGRAVPANPGSNPSPGFLSPGSGGRWSEEEDKQLRKAVDEVGARNWKRISLLYFNGSRSDVQCLHRWQKVLRPGLVKGPWTPEEDQIVIKCMQERIVRWSEIASRIPGRIGKQCRERWFNHLDPEIQKGGWTEAEDRLLVEAQARFGNRWSRIAKLIPGRAENAVKNRWNSSMRRKATAAAAGTPRKGAKGARKKDSAETKEEKEAKKAEREAKKAEREAKKAKKAAAAAAKKAKAAKDKAEKKKLRGSKKKRSKRKRNDDTSEAEEAANVMTFLASGMTNLPNKRSATEGRGSRDRDVEAASLNLANMLASIASRGNGKNGEGTKAAPLPNAAGMVSGFFPVAMPMNGVTLTHPPSLPIRVPLPSGGISSPTTNSGPATSTVSTKNATTTLAATAKQEI